MSHPTTTDHAVPKPGEEQPPEQTVENSGEAAAGHGHGRGHAAVVAPRRRRSKPSSYAGTGRPSKFRNWMLPVITRMAARNNTDADIAERLHVSGALFSRWKRESKLISSALDDGREHALDYVEKALLRRAVGWVGPTEKVLRDGRVVRHKQFHPPDTTAAMDVLTNRRPDKWKRKLEQGQGLGITVQINSPLMIAALAGSPPEQPALSVEQQQTDEKI